MSPSNICNTLVPAFYPILEALLKRALGIANSSCFDFSFIFSIEAKFCPSIGVFSYGKSKMSVGAKFDEYGG